MCIDDEAVEVPHEVAVAEDEAIRPERTGYRNEEDCEGEDAGETEEVDDMVKDPTWNETTDGNRDYRDELCPEFMNLVNRQDDDEELIA